MILAGDVGGTNVRLTLIEVEGGKLARKDEKTFLSRDVPGLEQPVEEFLAGRRVAASGFGVAGPVRNGRCKATNLPWVVDAAVLAKSLALPRVALVNDLFANALGLGELGPADFAVVNAGVEDPAGNAALIAAGTGLGEAYLVMVSGRFVPQASEGGHASRAACSWAAGSRRRSCRSFSMGRFSGPSATRGASPRSLREFRSRWS